MLTYKNVLVEPVLVDDSVEIFTKQGSKMSKVWPGWCLQVAYQRCQTK